MRLTHSEHSIDAHDLPGVLAGKCSTDVVLPSGEVIELHGCSEAASRILQDEIQQLSGVPFALPPEVALKMAIQSYERRLMEAWTQEAA